MAEPRAVRIARRPTATSSASPPAAPGGRFLPNRAGTARGARLFGLFGGFLVVIYVAFAALTLANPMPGVRENAFAWVTFSALALALGVWGWTITLGRAPRGVIARADELVVRERLGRLERVAWASVREMKTVQRYAASLVSPEPTELVELRSVSGRRRTYLVGAEYLRDVAAPAA